MAVLDDWANAISKLLNAAHDVSGSIASHGNIVGDAREVFIRDILNRFVPKSTYVGTGQIIDEKGNFSNQIDVVIYRSDFPSFQTLGQAEVFLLEGVIATIEVKSSLNKGTLTEALENCASVKRLNANVDETSLNEYTSKVFGAVYQELDDNQKEFIHGDILPPCYIFGYQGYKSRLNNFVETIKEWYFSKTIRELPDVICAKGCVAVKNLGQPFKFETDDKKWWGFVASVDEAPLRFMLSHLIQQIMNATGTPMHASTGVKYGISDYISPANLKSANWKGVVINKVIDKEQVEDYDMLLSSSENSWHNE